MAKVNGDLIKKIREQINLNQTDFGKKIGCKQNTVSQYEAGDAAPSIKIGMAIVKLAKKYKINVALENLYIYPDENKDTK